MLNKCQCQNVFTKALFEYVKQSGESDHSLEKQIGLPQGCLNGWRNNKYKPSLDALIKMSNFFKVSIDQLIGRETPPQAINVPLDIANMWHELDFEQQAEIKGEMKGMINTKKKIEKSKGTA